jgi:TrmH family RNA methyltransferase
MERRGVMELHSLTSLQHPLVKHLVKLRLDSAYRHEHQALVLEGAKPIQEVASLVTKLLYTPAYAAFASSFSGEKWQVTDAIVHKISGMISPEGIVAEIRMPSFVSLDKAQQVLALDGISDPGNIGTLLRTALALGWEAVYFLPGSCDPFNEKALRAARGAHFKLALAKGTAEDLQQWVQSEKVQSLVADLKGKVPEKVSMASRRLLVLGNEAHGASKAVRQFCEPVTLPMPGEMESLNVAVAGGILLYLLSNFRCGYE